MTRLKTILAVSAMLTGFALITTAQPRRGGGGGGPELLGTANVDGGADHDNVVVSDGRPYRSLQFRVQNGAINFQRVVVHFGNGQQAPVQLRNRIQAGGQTRWIDLPGERRKIESVEFWYSRGNWGVRRPRVEVYGRN